MPGYDEHEPDYSGTTESEWDAPKLEDFGTDDLSAIDDHLLLSSSGSPPEDFGDLALPVVEPGGDLNLNALETAHGGAHSVDAVEGIDDDTVESVRETIEELAASEFDHEIDGRGRAASTSAWSSIDSGNSAGARKHRLLARR